MTAPFRRDAANSLVPPAPDGRRWVSQSGVERDTEGSAARVERNVVFSQRVPSALALNRVTLLRESMAREGVEIVDLTQSNPTVAGFDYPLDLLASLTHAESLVYRPDPRGLAAARRAVADDWSRRGVETSPDRLVLTSSTSEAYSLLFKILCEPGDEVLVPRPSYPLFEHLTRLDAVSAVPYRLDEHAGWRVDLGSVDRALSARTRAVLAVSPNNPTGTFLRPEELREMASRVATHGAALIVDEVFAEYGVDEGTASRQAAPESAHCLLFRLGGLSKSIGLPQVKLGWIGVEGPEPVVREALDRLEFASDAYLSVSTPVQHAAADLLRQGGRVRAQIQERIRSNDAWLRRAATKHAAVDVLPVEGGWSAILRVPAIASEEDLVLGLLQSQRVLVHPGYFFDFPREAYLVVSLLVEPDRFADGMTRVLDHVDPLDGVDDGRA